MFKLARTTSFSLITLLLSCHSMLSRAEGDVETLIFYDDFPPFCYLDDGQAKGLFVDVVTAIFDDMGDVYETKSYPIKRALLSADRGQGIVVGILRNEERQKIFDYSSSFYTEKSMLFVSKGHKFSFSSVNDLKGKRVGVKLGWSYGSKFDQAKNAQLFTSVVGEPKQLYTLLRAGRLDVVVGNELSIPRLTKVMNHPVQVEALPTPLLMADLYIAAKKGTKVELIEKFNNHMEQIKVNGMYKNILKKYNRIN
jgi:polar amino acid transport system substrate-binding protein